MKEELEIMQQIMNDWTTIPLAVDNRDNLSRLDDDLNDWFTELEEAFLTIRSAIATIQV